VADEIKIFSRQNPISGEVKIWSRHSGLISLLNILSNTPSGILYKIPTGILVIIKNNFQYLIKDNLYLVGGSILLEGDAALVIH